MVRYTYSDYARWTDDNRWELIYGEPRMMAAPNDAHQVIVGNFSVLFGTYLRGRRCQFRQSPYDVRLNYDYDDFDDTVVQPDFIIVCDPWKFYKEGVRGAPDFVVEILSTSTKRHDRITKLKLYKDAGVREYWIVDPTYKTVCVHLFEHNRQVTYSEGDTIPVHILEGFSVEVDHIFENVVEYD